MNKAILIGKFKEVKLEKEASNYVVIRMLFETTMLEKNGEYISFEVTSFRKTIDKVDIDNFLIGQLCSITCGLRAYNKTLYNGRILRNINLILKNIAILEVKNEKFVDKKTSEDIPF